MFLQIPHGVADVALLLVHAVKLVVALVFELGDVVLNADLASFEQGFERQLDIAHGAVHHPHLVIHHRQAELLTHLQVDSLCRQEVLLRLLELTRVRINLSPAIQRKRQPPHVAG